MILGTGFPPFRGGLCRWADQLGTTEVTRTLEELASRVDERFAPSPALAAVGDNGGFYRAFPASAER
jgi:3-hydroxyacyl-CoA dehydrogenase/enoyl-CoA hydratase/3-hydroxybutyryl-CoA epimerase